MRKAAINLITDQRIAVVEVWEDGQVIATDAFHAPSDAVLWFAQHGFQPGDVTVTSVCGEECDHDE